MNKVVSVIVTSYNHEEYIEQCITSVFQQTYKALELIIIDDGSSDQTVSRIEKVLEDAPLTNIQFIVQEENCGVCYTRNHGLDLATGEFVLFVDSDDYLVDSFIEKLFLKLDYCDADIAYCDLLDVETNKIFMKAKDFDLISFLQGNYIINTSLIRRQVIGNSRYDLNLNRDFLEDYDFIMNLILQKNAKAVYTEDISLNYRVLDTSISRKDNHTQRAYFYKIYAYILKKHVNQFPDEIFTALNANSLILEDRLNELENHLMDVTEVIHDQKSKINQLTSTVGSLQDINNVLNREKTDILGSRSYRLGNRIINPLSKINLLLHNPRLIKKVLKVFKERIARAYKKRPSIKIPVLKTFRDIQRKTINIKNERKRILIYVIYENQSTIQKYKVIFLESLASLCDEILIVVNGDLSESDRKILTGYGEVVVRENEGYDTAAFRHGILTLGQEHLKQFDELLLVNDTNIGPFGNIEDSFKKMEKKNIDFWGISYGEEQADITGINPYKYIPVHLQTFFLVIEKNLLNYSGFYRYWESLEDTNSRNKAIGKHETVFTKHFGDLGFRHSALTLNNQDSAMYIHPLTMLKEGVPLIKYTALNNYSDEKFLWQGLQRRSEIPELLNYLENETDYPMTEIDHILEVIKEKENEKSILIIDGVENAIPQCTRYRVLNKAEQLRNFGFQVKTVNLSQFRLLDAEYASLIIIYRCGYSQLLAELCLLAKKFNKTVLYDIDDLVIDTKYTNQLSYTQQLSKQEKENYDASVDSYGNMLRLCDGAVTSTNKLQMELLDYQNLVLLNRNVASKELVELSEAAIQNKQIDPTKVKLGYFSGSITHNENFELIEKDIVKLLKAYSNVELHLVGHLSIPKEFAKFRNQIVLHDYVDWRELPALICQVDINLAPLVDSIFNEAKSEIKWSEAALVEVPTVASNIGAFKDMVEDGITGLLVNDGEWYYSLEKLIVDSEFRNNLAKNANHFVVKNCVTFNKDALVNYMITFFNGGKVN